MTETLTPDEIAALFTRSDGSFLCARWGRPIAPVVFGVDDRTLGIFKGAIEAVVTLAGHGMAETDPELGANLMVFFVRDWAELTEVPHLDRMIPDLAPLVERLQEAGANQYRIFRFDAAGGIKACFVLLRLDDVMAEMEAETLALGQAVQSLLVWSDTAFAARSALVQGADGTVVLRPEIGALIRAAHDPVLPGCSCDPAHALRLQARMRQA